MRVFNKDILRTSAVSSTNLGSILIFASSVVGTWAIITVFLRYHDGFPIRTHLVVISRPRDRIYLYWILLDYQMISAC